MKVGFTASAFDLFHAGHVMMLREAKTQCDYLIAAVQTNPNIDREHKARPIQSITERLIQVQACRYVDEVIVYETEQDLYEILLAFPIDVRIIGEEYKSKKFTGDDLDIPIYYNVRRHNWSTSNLRDQVAKREFERGVNVVKDIQV